MSNKGEVRKVRKIRHFCSKFTQKIPSFWSKNTLQINVEKKKTTEKNFGSLLKCLSFVKFIK